MNGSKGLVFIRSQTGKLWKAFLPRILAGAVVLTASRAWSAEEGGVLATPARHLKPSGQMVDDPNALLTTGGTLEITFDEAMVAASEIDVETAKSPIVFDPELRGRFMWKSQTEGEFTCAAVPPGTSFKVLHAPGLLDLAGRPVGKQGQLIGIRKSGEFTVTCDFTQRSLERRPAVSLRFSVSINPADLAEAAWFQDRDSRARFPVVVILEPETAEKAVTSATVTPRVDLPPGRTFDLLVDGLKDAATGTALKRPFVGALGETDALKVINVAGFNYPLRQPRITVQFSEAVEPEQGRRIRIDPAVAVKTAARGDELWLEGAFDIHQHYRVTVPPEVVGQRGFALAGPSVWGASFHAKKPSLIFTTEDLHQRSSLGLRFGFIQVNTGPLQWRLARIPPEKMLAISARLREFSEIQRDPFTGTDAIDADTGLPVWKSSESLIDASRLQTVAQGMTEPSPGDADARREISWKEEHGVPAGMYVLEVAGKLGTRKTLVNRAMVTFTEYAATQKRINGNCLLRVTQISNGQPAPGMRVRVIGRENELLAESVTDDHGVAIFDQRAKIDGRDASKPAARWFQIETADGPLLQAIEATRFSGSGFESVGGTAQPAAHRLLITCDRPIYRPGQTLKMKGFVRQVEADGTLRVPRARDVAWEIKGADDAVASGAAKLDNFGGFEAEWIAPLAAPVGKYQLGATFQGVSESQDFVIQEFKPPPFLVTLADLKSLGDVAGLRISSAYFHGAPNAGAHAQWEAIWRAHSSTDPAVVITDVPRQTSVQPEMTGTVKGEGVLTADGALEVKVKPPFKDNVIRGWYDVEWSVDVTAADAQTISGKADFSVHAVPVELSATAVQKVGVETEANPLMVALDAQARGDGGQTVEGVALSMELYRVETKSVKEEISPNVYRYRNSVTYKKERFFEGRTPLKQDVRVREPGDYLVVIRDSTNPKVPPTTAQVYVAGPGEAAFPLRDEQSIGVTCDRKMDDSNPRSGYVPGEKAMISVQAPFTGAAWVSVEGEKVLETLFVSLDGNSSRFELPIKKEYGPNAWVTVYLLHPGGEDRLPSERFGAVQIKVRRPDLVLQVTPQLVSKQVQPKEMIGGQIVITDEGRPVAGADLTVYAVDEAVLDAGDWHEPHLLDAMYPERRWEVGTYQGLPHLTFGVDETSLHQKGFIIGGGEAKSVMEAAGVAELRTNFPPLAFWKTHLTTDREGKASFAFQAPDVLTKYRVIALAQTKEGHFGTGSEGVEISKPVQLEPALPRFVRVGDELELRVIVRQKMAEELAVKVHCKTEFTLQGENTQEQRVRRNVPTVYRFHATVGEREAATVRFQTESGSRDAVEVTLPVHPPTLLRKEVLFGSWEAIRERIPADWTNATGAAEVTFSSSPWLPKLTGLPLLLEYPHGCFEQITSRILGYTELADLLAWLPEPAARRAEYRRRVETGLEQIQTSLSEEGFLPYWPGGKGDAYPTVAGCWAVQRAIAQGLPASSKVEQALAEATRSIARGDSRGVAADLFCRAFALTVLSQKPAETKAFAPVAREMYLRREASGAEVRALLAIAMHRFGIMPAEQAQLLQEIDGPVPEHAFEPLNFGSSTRSEAICALALATVNPEGASGQARERLRARLEDFLDSSQSLSTQEDFWLLLAFQALHGRAARVASASFQRAGVPAQVISPNGASAVWSGLDIRKIREFDPRLNRAEGLTCLVSARFRTDAQATKRAGNGFRVERLTKNLTNAARNGSEKTPYLLGDQLLITYRLVSPKLHHFVALEDELPGGLETVNPDIASIARTYAVPPEKGARQLALSHAERRDRVTCLYFDRVDAGIATYSVLARATCAGVFHWPATQVVPMYDSRFSGLSPSEICHISAE